MMPPTVDSRPPPPSTVAGHVMYKIAKAKEEKKAEPCIKQFLVLTVKCFTAATLTFLFYYLFQGLVTGAWNFQEPSSHVQHPVKQRIHYANTPGRKKEVETPPTTTTPKTEPKQNIELDLNLKINLFAMFPQNPAEPPMEDLMPFPRPLIGCNEIDSGNCPPPPLIFKIFQDILSRNTKDMTSTHPLKQQQNGSKKKSKNPIRLKVNTTLGKGEKHLNKSDKGLKSKVKILLIPLDLMNSPSKSSKMDNDLLPPFMSNPFFQSSPKLLPHSNKFFDSIFQDLGKDGSAGIDFPSPLVDDPFLRSINKISFGPEKEPAKPVKPSVLSSGQDLVHSPRSKKPKKKPHESGAHTGDKQKEMESSHAIDKRKVKMEVLRLRDDRSKLGQRRDKRNADAPQAGLISLRSSASLVNRAQNPTEKPAAPKPVANVDPASIIPDPVAPVAQKAAVGDAIIAKIPSIMEVEEGNSTGNDTLKVERYHMAHEYEILGGSVTSNDSVSATEKALVAGSENVSEPKVLLTLQDTLEKSNVSVDNAEHNDTDTKLVAAEIKPTLAAKPLQASGVKQVSVHASVPVGQEVVLGGSEQTNISSGQSVVMNPQTSQQQDLNGSSPQGSKIVDQSPMAPQQPVKPKQNVTSVATSGVVAVAGPSIPQASSVKQNSSSRLQQQVPSALNPVQTNAGQAIGKVSQLLSGVQKSAQPSPVTVKTPIVGVTPDQLRNVQQVAGQSPPSVAQGAIQPSQVSNNQGSSGTAIKSSTSVVASPVVESVKSGTLSPVLSPEVATSIPVALPNASGNQPNIPASNLKPANPIASAVTTADPTRSPLPKKLPQISSLLNGGNARPIPMAGVSPSAQLASGTVPQAPPPQSAIAGAAKPIVASPGAANPKVSPQVPVVQAPKPISPIQAQVPNIATQLKATAKPAIAEVQSQNAAQAKPANSQIQAQPIARSQTDPRIAPPVAANPILNPSNSNPVLAAPNSGSKPLDVPLATAKASQAAGSAAIAAVAPSVAGPEIKVPQRNSNVAAAAQTPRIPEPVQVPKQPEVPVASNPQMAQAAPSQ